MSMGLNTDALLVFSTTAQINPPHSTSSLIAAWNPSMERKMRTYQSRSSSRRCWSMFLSPHYCSLRFHGSTPFQHWNTRRKEYNWQITGIRQRCQAVKMYLMCTFIWLSWLFHPPSCLYVLSSLLLFPVSNSVQLAPYWFSAEPVSTKRPFKTMNTSNPCSIFSFPDLDGPYPAWATRTSPGTHSICHVRLPVWWWFRLQIPIISARSWACMRSVTWLNRLMR